MCPQESLVEVYGTHDRTPVHKSWGKGQVGCERALVRKGFIGEVVLVLRLFWSQSFLKVVFRMDKVGRCSGWCARYVQRLGHLETTPCVWGSADVSAMIPQQGYRTHMEKGPCQGRQWLTLKASTGSHGDANKSQLGTGQQVVKEHPIPKQRWLLLAFLALRNKRKDKKKRSREPL